MIDPDNHRRLLSAFDLGTSTAENDPLLEVAKIETQQFADLYFYDRIDIIKGIKGAGKTALYRLCHLLKEFFIRELNIYCIFGVEASGDPVFRIFRKEFEDFNEIEFENFWSIYFISLIYGAIYTDDKLRDQLKDNLSLIDKILSDIGLRFTKNSFTLKDSIGTIWKIISERKVKVGAEFALDQATGQLKSITPTFEIDPRNVQDISTRPFYTSDFRDKLIEILRKKNVKIFIMLDRLDEVFPHRSNVEKTGLRGLLKAQYNFSHPYLRPKIFLRDDIIGYLASDGFTALTHVADRCSSTISWSKDELLNLITKRISAHSILVSYYKIDRDQIDKDKGYREKIFYEIFPQKMGKTFTIDWIYANCADANEIVTPRDMIDLFNYAKAEQFRQHRLNPDNQKHLISPTSFVVGLDELSKHKKETFLFAEFPHLKEHFLKFEGKHSEYTLENLQEILGPDYLKILDDLRSIGFIKSIPKSATYRIPVIWRKGLNIRRGRFY